MRTFALEHIVGNWDSYGYGNGQNMYAYKPANDSWKLMIWDLDIGFGSGGGPTTPLFSLSNSVFPWLDGDQIIVQRMYETAEMARAYWRALSDAATGPMAEKQVDGFLDPRFAVLSSALAPSIVLTPADAKNFIRQRRSFILNKLNSIQTEFKLIQPAELDLETEETEVLLTGTAPIEVRTIMINDTPFQVDWTSVSTWEFEYPIRRNRKPLRFAELIGRGCRLSPLRRT